jgi:hypothetical protein
VSGYDFFTQMAIYPMLKANRPSHANVSNILFTRAYSAVFYHHGDIDQESKKILTKNISEEKWIKDFHQFTILPLIWPEKQPPAVNTVKTLDSATKIRLFLKLLVQNPHIIAQEYLDVSSTLWALFEGADPMEYTNRYCFGINTDLVTFSTHPSAAQKAAENLLNFTANITILDAFFWRPGIIIILFLFTAYFAGLTDMSKLNIILIPIFSNFIALLPTVISHEYRFSYQIYI